MSFHVQLFLEDVQEKAKIQEWLNHPTFHVFQISNKESVSPNDIVIIEINSLFDWKKVRRMKEQCESIIIFPLLAQSMIHTSPLALELQLPALFTKPLKRNVFFRHFKKIISLFSEMGMEEEVNNMSGESFRDLFWRKVLKAEVDEEDIANAYSLISLAMVPNLICVIQGFVVKTNEEKQEDWEASSVVQKTFMKAMNEIDHEASFISFHKHAVLMLKVPFEVATPSFWKEGEQALLKAIEFLKENYGIHLYIGVGSIARELLQLKESYEHAKIARKSVAKHHLSLRYFDEIPTNISVQKSVDYIQAHFMDNLSMNEVAATINFSPTYFSRLFKKETGHSFVSYLTLIRILRSIWLLRRTNQTIEQIAMDLGFNTPNYFSSTFKKEIGLSPSQYRATKEILFSHNWSEDDF